MTTVLRAHAAPVLVLLLLGGICAERALFHLPPGDPDAFHARVRDVAEHVPDRIGDWVGTVVEPPASAVSLLKPNYLRSLRFENATTKERASLVMVQCRDARDMTGHWPPNCYPAHGWTLRSTAKKDLLVGRRKVPVTAYRFTIEAIDRYEEIVVYNFFARPDGVVEDGREGVRQVAEDPRMKVFGAAQFQVVFEAHTPEPRRDEVFRTLVGGVFPLVETLLEGARP
jgi:hypothetical protein